MKEHYLKEELYHLLNHDRRIFDFIQSGSLDGVWYWDLENPENEWMSPKFWEVLGYDPKVKKPLANEWQAIIFQEDLPRVLENLDKHYKKPTHTFDQIVRYRHKNGSTVWVRCRGMAIRDEEGKPIRLLGAHVDVTDLKHAEREITRLSREYEKVFNGTQDAMFLMEVLSETEFRYIRNNASHQKKTKISLEMIQNQSPRSLLGEEMGDLVAGNYQRCVKNRKPITYEEELSLPGGDRVWLTTLTPIIEESEVRYIVGSAADITERKQLERELEMSANYDDLTKIPNRRLFFDRLKIMIFEHERDLGKFALIYIDLDGFKEINDRYGHETGDGVLVTVAERLKKTLRKSDTVARMGGDEFTVLLRDIGSQESIERVVKKIRVELQQEMNINGVICTVGASMGIAVYPDQGKDSETLLQEADTAMYVIKNDGKGGYKFSPR